MEGWGWVRWVEWKRAGCVCGGGGGRTGAGGLGEGCNVGRPCMEVLQTAAG
jgi:hypothetical protein